MRVYTDGSAELVRWGKISKKWVFLLFPPEQAPDAVDKIKAAIKQHFVLTLPTVEKDENKDKTKNTDKDLEM